MGWIGIPKREISCGLSNLVDALERSPSGLGGGASKHVVDKRSENLETTLGQKQERLEVMGQSKKRIWVGSRRYHSPQTPKKNPQRARVQITEWRRMLAKGLVNW
eukprot:c3558_g1_i1 orf=78-392(+)